MIKVFDTTQDYEIYSADGLKSGEFCYVAEDKTVYFRTNNIDGEDKVYDTGGGSDEPEYNELQSEDATVNIPCAVGDVLEIICSDENGFYMPAALLDDNMEDVGGYVQNKSMSTNAYTWYVLISENNAAYLAFVNQNGTNLTASYRKLN